MENQSKNKKGLNFFFLVIAILLGWSLYKEFDHDTNSFKNSALAIIYAVVLMASIYFLIRDYKSQSKK